MPQIRIETFINAPVERVFDLARDLRIHVQTTGNSREKVVEGPASGLVQLGDIVTFEAVHFGLKQRLTSKIVEYERPRLFVDEMQRGAFKRLRHRHVFQAREDCTIMIDELDFASPLGPLGVLADTLVLRRYMENFLRKRGETLRRIAEN